MNNTYGTVRSAKITADDVEIWYNFRPKRNSTDSKYKTFKKIENVSSVLSNAIVDDDSLEDNDNESILTGMYNLQLPVSIFNQVGYYTLYIKPREIRCTIQNTGALAAYPDVRGLVFNNSDLESMGSNNGLCGYRIEYFDDNNERQQYYRLITSSNLCEPVSQNLTSGNTDSQGYRFNESGSLCFITVSPSTAPSFKTNSIPYIGSASQKVSIINTKFDPICIEIEMCKNDFDTITTHLTGNQVRSLDNGIVTTYNENGEIFVQYEFYTVKDNYNNRTVKEVKRQRTDDISMDNNYDEIFNTNT